MRGVCAAVLTFEALVIALAIPVAVVISDVDAEVAVPIGLGLAVACLLTAGLLRRPVGYLLGSGLQVVAVGLGFVVPAMFLLGGLFALLWFLAIHLGRRVEQAEADRAADGGIPGG